MNTWLQFLTEQGASIDTLNGKTQVTGFKEMQFPLTPAADFVTPLTDLGLIAVSGEDAAKFLHNQLTNDIERLGPAEARLAGYCSAKGRLLATFLVWKSGETILLSLPRQIQLAVQKRLQMFVLRAKAHIVDASEAHVMLGLAGENAAQLLTTWFPSLPASPYTKLETEAGILIRVDDANGLPRYQWICPPDLSKAAWSALTKVIPPAGTHAWRLGDIHAGIPQVTQATQDQFVPQMLNFEIIGGVNFKKGCYPGQEVVARSQYLGKLKRRTVLASLATLTAAPGMEVFSSLDPTQPCGMVVNAERASEQSMDCLIEVKIAALSTGTIHLQSLEGPVCHIRPLPYNLPDAI